MKVSRGLRTLTFYLMLILTIFIATFFLLLSIDNKNNADELKNHIENDRLLLESMANEFTKDISQALDDILFLEAHYQHEKSQSGEMDLETFLLMIAQKERIYDQIRFIDQRGHELIRVNYDGISGRIVGEDELQDKSNRYYFTETIRLSKGEIYISPLDLNIENGELEIPYKPMLRFATPLIHPERGLEGIVITNLLAQTLLDRIVNISKSATDHLALINNDGYIIAYEDPEITFGFMIESRQKQSLLIQYPDVWQSILSGSEFIQNESGIFQVKVIDLKETLPEGINFSDQTHLFYGITCIENGESFGYLFDRGTMDQVVRVLKTNGVLIFLVILAGLILNFILILLRYRQKRILHYAQYDALTETFNRRAGLERINQRLKERQAGGISLSLCFIDIDNLKTVNDGLGHPMGDLLISTVARILKDEIRNKDILCRYGGDEFILFLEEIDALAGERVWERIQLHLDNFNLSEGAPFEISLSHGIVTYDPHRHRTLEALIREADQKMYALKTARKQQ